MDVLRPAAFWLRRMLHDTIVHHADATGGTGAEFEVAPDLAAHAITEWLELLSDPVIRRSNRGSAALRGTGQTLRIRPDTGRGWLITRTPSGVRWAQAAGPADATLAGPVADLLLVLTRRLPVEQVSIAGNRDVADHWLAHTAA